MIMYEDASLFRLQQIKERIEKADSKQVVQTVGIDLYRSIRSDDRLWQVWNERITYFQSLAKNKEVLKAEQVAIKATKKVVTILLKIIDSHPERDKQGRGFYFTPNVQYDYPEETEPTLEEKLKVHLDSENYFSVKDQGKFMVSPSGHVWYLRDSPTDVGSFHNCNRVLNQHRSVYKYVQEFVETKIYDEVVRGNRNKKEELAEAFQELAEAIEPIELKLLTDARALHTGEFERVLLTAAAFDHSVLGRVTKGFEALDKNPHQIEKIKKSGIDVCEELAYGLLKNEQGIIPLIPKKNISTHSQPELSWVRFGDFDFCHQPLTIKIGKETYDEKSSPENEGQKNDNKALRVIALFIPTSEEQTKNFDNPVKKSFTDIAMIAKKLKMKTRSASVQVSNARSFLKRIGSKCEISTEKPIKIVTP